jgi:hypothetical protein
VSAVEYALGVGVTVAALLLGIDAATDSSADAYRSRRDLVTTGVTSDTLPVDVESGSP